SIFFAIQFVFAFQLAILRPDIENHFIFSVIVNGLSIILLWLLRPYRRLVRQLLASALMFGQMAACSFLFFAAQHSSIQSSLLLGANILFALSWIGVGFSLVAAGFVEYRDWKIKRCSRTQRSECGVTSTDSQRDSKSRAATEDSSQLEIRTNGNRNRDQKS